MGLCEFPDFAPTTSDTSVDHNRPVNRQQPEHSSGTLYVEQLQATEGTQPELTLINQQMAWHNKKFLAPLH